MMKVYLFGKLVDVAGKKELVLENQNYSDDLLNTLKKDWPALASYNFLLSVNQEVISENRILSVDDEIALLPPFSGG